MEGGYIDLSTCLYRYNTKAKIPLTNEQTPKQHTTRIKRRKWAGIFNFGVVICESFKKKILVFCQVFQALSCSSSPARTNLAPFAFYSLFALFFEPG
jgi:hypothetical protein